MRPLIKTIALNETSLNVHLLHQALGVLGYRVDQGEIDRRAAGTSTLQQVRTLQQLLDIPVDDSTLVDGSTAIAIDALLKERRFTVAKRSFTVSGSVRDTDGNVHKRQLLCEYDLDLRGAGTYRTVAALASLDQNGGFEFL